MPELLKPLYQSSFNINEKRMPTLKDFKQGQTINLLLNYKVVEKRKDYVVLKISHATPKEIRRVY